MPTKPRASTAYLQPGQTSIDRATPRQRDGVWRLNWSVRLHDGRLVKRKSEAPTKGEMLRRARKAADELLKTSNSTWKLGDDLEHYFNTVSVPALNEATLRQRSRDRYAVVSKLLFGRCEAHKHVDSLKGHTIDSGTRLRALETCLKEIAALHGGETARQARNVASKYLLGELVRDNLLRANPLAAVRLNLGSSAKPVPVKRGGQSLTRAEYQAVIDHLLAMDADAAVTAVAKDRRRHDARVAKLQSSIDLTLLQAATGLRINEALSISWADVVIDANGLMHVNISTDLSKTHRGRTVPVLDDRVQARLLGRREAQGGVGRVIGSPLAPRQPWDSTNAMKAVAALYKDLSVDLSIATLATARSHVWRTTLNTLLVDQVPEVVRAAHFGHSVEVNRGSYTDATDTSSLVAAARSLHKGQS